MTQSRIIWLSMWISWLVIVILPAVHSKEDIITVKGGRMYQWKSQAYKLINLKDAPGENWNFKNNKEDLYTCGTGGEAGFLMITSYVNLSRTLADVIHVDVEAELIQCFDPGRNLPIPCYANYFEVYIYRGTDDVNVYKPRDSSATNLTDLLKVYSPLYNITSNTLADTKSTKTNQTFSFPQHNSQGVVFALLSRGACGSLFRMKIYHNFCEETFVMGVKFERTASPAKGFKNVTGKCSEYAIPLINGTASFNRYCYKNGTWSIIEDENLKCFCTEGYTPNRTDGSCSSCSSTSYKKSISNDNCTECPTNTVSTMNRTNCVCKIGYYKSSSDNSQLSPCYALPLLREKPTTRRIAYGVELSWTKPNNSRNETILYNVECFICNQSICNISCTNETYNPGSKNLSLTLVTVSNLIPGNRYVFRVYARSSLNDNVPKVEWGFNQPATWPSFHSTQTVLCTFPL